MARAPNYPGRPFGGRFDARSGLVAASPRNSNGKWLPRPFCPGRLRRRWFAVGFATAAALVHELIEARDDKRLLRLQKRLVRLELPIIDELGFVPV